MSTRSGTYSDNHEDERSLDHVLPKNFGDLGPEEVGVVALAVDGVEKGDDRCCQRDGIGKRGWGRVVVYLWPLRLPSSAQDGITRRPLPPPLPRPFHSPLSIPCRSPTLPTASPRQTYHPIMPKRLIPPRQQRRPRGVRCLECWLEWDAEDLLIFFARWVEEDGDIPPLGLEVGYVQWTSLALEGGAMLDDPWGYQLRP
jgi:hypothetical protein